MFKKLMDKINDKSIELHVENQTAEAIKPRELKITIKILSFDIAIIFFIICAIDGINYFAGIDKFGIFGLTYAKLLTNYLLVLLVENVWSYFKEKKSTVKPPQESTPPTA